MQNYDALRYQSASKNSPSSSRILYDVACKVCQDNSSGKHYGIFACDGCAGFFKRSIRRNRQYICKGKSEGNCIVDKTHRNQCRACRLRKCVNEGMNKDAVQHERGPRNSTLQRQMMLYFKDPLTDGLSGGNSSLNVGPDIGSSSRESPNSSPTLQDDNIIRTSKNNLLSPRLPISPFYYPSQLFSFPLSGATASIPLPNMFALNNAETVCEWAASLLFMNVKWTKSVPAFTSLPIDDQLMLLEESWHELFVLGAAQYLPPLELGSLVGSCVESKKSHDEKLTIVEEVTKLLETITKLKQLQVDPHEYACLRATVLFKTVFEEKCIDDGSDKSDEKSLKDSTAVKNLHEDSQQMLNRYVSTVYPLQPLRLGRLCLLLTSCRTVSAPVIEELFFRRHTGPIPISRIICDMYKYRYLKPI